MKPVKIEEILEHFDEIDIYYLKQQAIKLEATHIVLAENLNLSSQFLGQKSALLVGGEASFKINECEGKWLNDLPSQRQYFTEYAEIENWLEKGDVEKFNQLQGEIIDLLDNGEISEDEFYHRQKAIENRFEIYDYRG